MPLMDAKYKYNQTIIKLYDNGIDKKIKVIKMNILRTSGVEDESDKNRLKRCTVNDVKLANNITRAKNRIFEYAFCNPWDYFFTGTLDKNKYNRSDLKKFNKDLSQYIRNYNRKHNLQIKYLFIPELHEDGISWHIHGLIYGLPVEHLKQFKLGDKMGKKLVAKVKRGDTVYNWCAYAEKFGFCSFEPLKNAEAISKYITKYVNKSLSNSVKELNANLYYHSCGLNTAKTLKSGTLLGDITPDFENEYCSISWLDYDEDVVNTLIDMFVDDRHKSIYDYMEIYDNDNTAGF